MPSPREQQLNEITRRLLIQNNYDPHFSTLEDRNQVENRLFLARWDAMCQLAGRDPTTLLPLRLPQRRNTARGTVYTEIARGEYLTNEPARPGVQLVAYRDDQGSVWVRMVSEYEDGRYEWVR